MTAQGWSTSELEKGQRNEPCVLTDVWGMQLREVMSVTQAHTASQKKRAGLKAHLLPQPTPSHLLLPAPRNTNVCESHVNTEDRRAALLAVDHRDTEHLHGLPSLPLQPHFCFRLVLRIEVSQNSGVTPGRAVSHTPARASESPGPSGLAGQG